ncbi:hypothetical protein [Roseinatronobacter sp.]|uniref:hypothetical protein n=1 Tax=Roseinatronobacter sp. TaxID=1945755 RepID=UPI0025EC4D35|nr:hypothetical protein [Roseibaca sp.]
MTDIFTFKPAEIRFHQIQLDEDLFRVLAFYTCADGVILQDQVEFRKFEWFKEQFHTSMLEDTLAEAFQKRVEGLTGHERMVWKRRAKVLDCVSVSGKHDGTLNKRAMAAMRIAHPKSGEVGR